MESSKAADLSVLGQPSSQLRKRSQTSLYSAELEKTQSSGFGKATYPAAWPNQASGLGLGSNDGTASHFLMPNRLLPIDVEKERTKKDEANVGGDIIKERKNKRKELKRKYGKPKGPVDVEGQCAVILPNGAPCARSLTCKSHSMGEKRAVPGRSLPYDMLLEAYQEKCEARPPPEIRNGPGFGIKAPTTTEGLLNTTLLTTSEEDDLSPLASSQYSTRRQPNFYTGGVTVTPIQNYLMTALTSSKMRVRSSGHIQVLNWDRHREHIVYLYETENRPLREVCDIMRQSHGFVATQRMYKTKFKAWDVTKYRVHRLAKRYDRQVEQSHARSGERIVPSNSASWMMSGSSRRLPSPEGEWSKPLQKDQSAVSHHRDQESTQRLAPIPGLSKQGVTAHRGKGAVLIPYTVSEDRTGNPENVMRQRLSALGRCYIYPPSFLLGDFHADT